MNTVKMKSIVALFAASVVAFSARAAEPKETVSNAIKAVKDKGNYSWSTSSEIAGGQFPATTTKGKTDNEGFALLSREGPNGEIQSATKGEKRVTKMEDGWKTPEEMQAAGGRGGFGGGFFGGAQLAPADEAEGLLKDIKDLKAGDGGVFTAELTEAGAKNRAGFGGRGGRGGNGTPPPEPKDAKGTVKFWIKDGMLAKYELTTAAKITFQDQEREVGRTMITEITAVGSTKVDVPDEAKKKLQ